MTELQRLDGPAKRRLVARAIAQTQGNIRRAAFLLGVTPRLVYYRIEQWQLWPVVNEARKVAQHRKARVAQRQRLRRSRKLLWVTDED